MVVSPGQEKLQCIAILLLYFLSDACRSRWQYQERSQGQRTWSPSCSSSSRRLGTHQIVEIARVGRSATGCSLASCRARTPEKAGSHGTAVLGVIGAGDNGCGVTGISPGAVLRVAPQRTLEHGFNTARAISLATAVSSPGDVILLENQFCVCELECDYKTLEGFGPSEYHQPVFDATATSTALGIVVVATAGNGNVDLDSVRCGRKFDRSVRDSGAIVVGAGDSGNRSKRDSSTYGSRVDLQGWGHNIVTTGYGDLFDPGDIRQRYRRSFGGTSGAAPIATGAVLSIQGIARTAGLSPLSPQSVRRLLVSTGTAQANDGAGHIGPPGHRAIVLHPHCGWIRDRHAPGGSGA